jgi:hypothetical protein
MCMGISPPVKAATVALATGAWLTQADASLGRWLVLAANAACFAFAWIVFSPPAAALQAASDEPAAAGVCATSRHIPTAHRSSHALVTRRPRDVRCPASYRATARARRSTRR